MVFFLPLLRVNCEGYSTTGSYLVSTSRRKELTSSMISMVPTVFVMTYSPRSLVRILACKRRRRCKVYSTEGVYFSLFLFMAVILSQVCGDGQHLFLARLTLDTKGNLDATDGQEVKTANPLCFDHGLILSQLHNVCKAPREDC